MRVVDGRNQTPCLAILQSVHCGEPRGVKPRLDSPGHKLNGDGDCMSMVESHRHSLVGFFESISLTEAMDKVAEPAIKRPATALRATFEVT